MSDTDHTSESERTAGAEPTEASERPAAGETLLDIEHLDAFYGTSQELFDLSLSIAEREVVGVFGRNGMGKTTLLRSIVNQLVRRDGTITYKDEDITDLQTYQIVGRGIAYVPEDRAIYSELSVEQNLRLAIPSHLDSEEATRRREQAYEQFPQLRERSDHDGGSLSGGEQQMLAISRGLVTDPDLLLLDEPTEGLAPAIADDVMDIIHDLADQSRTIVLVEQHINRYLSVIDRGYILVNGRIAVEAGTETLADEDLQEEYLGLG